MRELVRPCPALRSAFALSAAALFFACSSGHPAERAGARDGGGGAGKSDAGGRTGSQAAARDGGASPQLDAGLGGADAGDSSNHDRPFVATGKPLSAPELTWTFIDFADTQCRDGSPAGLAVSLNSASDKVMIFLDGGGACFDTLTCAGNLANVSTQREERTMGIFDRARSEKPVQDWNIVFVPYCTGDVHGGTNEDGMIDGLPQKFVGRLNLEKFLHRIVPTFTDSSQVLLTGSSAGGFGAALNLELVQWAFGSTPVTAIDDSGPPMSSEYVPECLQQRWRTVWGFDRSFLADCADDCPNPNDYALDYMKHVAAKYPDKLSGLIETTGDSVITLFYGFGNNDCTSIFPLPVPEQRFREGLLDFRETSMSLGRFGTYFIASSVHTWLRDDTFYTQTSPDGVKLVDWYRDIVEGRAAAHVGP
jgi:hypothetical protein